MARRRSISDEQIIEAAKTVFFEKGYSGTTAEIAHAAGISEGTIFRRFENKRDLFLVALGIDREPSWFKAVDELVGVGDVRENLRVIMTMLYDFLRGLLPKVMCMFGSPVRAFELMSVDGQPPIPIRGQLKLLSFFEAELAAGRIRSGNSVAMARTVFGTLHSQAFMEVVGFDVVLPIALEVLIDQVIGYVLGPANCEGV
ncbi:MAG: hypothetical protein AUK47_26720 [Deltaproteobacteria bacterium CG2_30_63_29]|nr:MAG: hypothetical protein AUK47_26720 [Deltaproteobacteria bacterium CG2_30_63_29]